MKIGNTAIKATLMATVIFWSVLFTEEYSSSMFFWIIPSIIPIFLCCLLAIIFTVCPFFWFSEDSLGNSDIFKRYFPYYAIAVFGVCAFAIWKFNCEVFAIGFFSSAFFTLMQTWVWNSKNDANENL